MPTPLKPLTPQRKTHTQSTSTMNAIKDYILQSNLKPGDPLPTETAMCESLAVSRSSVREAIRTLAALDIVEVRHGHGMFVGRVSMQPMVELLAFRGMLHPGDDFRSLAEIVEVRQALDEAFAASACAAWEGKHDPELHQAIDEMEQLAEAGEPFPQQDRLFHSRLLGALDNQLFRQLTEAFWDVHTLTGPLLGAPDPSDIQDTAKAHRGILEAAEAGDVSAYRRAVGQHYAPLLRNLRGAQAGASQ